jgi:hypothetical protein
MPHNKFSAQPKIWGRHRPEPFPVPAVANAISGKAATRQLRTSQGLAAGKALRKRARRQFALSKLPITNFRLRRKFEAVRGLDLSRFRLPPQRLQGPMGFAEQIPYEQFCEAKLRPAHNKFSGLHENLGASSPHA